MDYSAILQPSRQIREKEKQNRMWRCGFLPPPKNESESDAEIRSTIEIASEYLRLKKQLSDRIRVLDETSRTVERDIQVLASSTYEPYVVYSDCTSDVLETWNERLLAQKTFCETALREKAGADATEMWKRKYDYVLNRDDSDWNNILRPLSRQNADADDR